MVTIIDIQNIEVHQDELFNFIKYINDVCKSIPDNVTLLELQRNFQYNVWKIKKQKKWWEHVS